MPYFQKQFSGYNLYTGQQVAGDRGFVAFIVPGANIDKQSIELQDALSNTGYAGSFVFSAQAPDITEANVKDFIGSVLGTTGNVRSFIWLKDPVHISVATTSLINISGDGTTTYASAVIDLSTGLSLQMQNGLAIQLNGTTLSFDGSMGNSNIFLSGAQAQLQTTMAQTASIEFSGSYKGCINFRTFITLPSLYNYLQWGFQYVYPSGSDTNPYNSEWLPLGLASPAADSIGFSITIDPSDVYNKAFDPCTTACTLPGAYASRRTFLSFTGKNLLGDATVINSNYTTKFGAPINLTPVITAGNALPARLVITKAIINPSQTTEFLLSPEGDFSITAPSVTDPANLSLLGGLSATEYFTFTQNDVIRFISRQPAYAAQFPFQSNGSSVSGTALLAKDFTTSWATLLPGTSGTIQYISQPQGASLYAPKQDVYADSKNLLGFFTSATSFTSSDNATSFPLAPYAVFSGDTSNAQLFERQILSPVRKACIAKAVAAQLQTAVSQRKLIPADKEVIIESTSPQGFYIKVEQSTGIWDELQLASNTVEEMVKGNWVSKSYQLQFTAPGTTLQSAFQTNQLFLVMSCDEDGKVLGTSFTKNIMSIAGWPFIFNIPTKNPNGLFSNVLIFKFIKNTPLTQLVQTPQQWTLPDSLNYTKGQGMQVLTQWLNDYITQACNRFTVNGDADYQKFYSVVTDPNWQGVLGLNVNIKLSQFPEQLQGLLAGIDLNRFSAHHFGIEINNVELKPDGTLAMQPKSSLFGLIDYEDTLFQSYNYSVTTYQQQAPINTSADYVFKVLSLKVLFENSAIVNFGSYLALTINKLFGEKIKHDNRQNLVIFQGAYEDHDNCPVYTFNSIPASSSQSGSSSDYMLFASSTVINDVEISSASFNTLVSQSDQDESKIVYSAFALNGLINYYSLDGFDIFSFGNEGATVTPGEGLAFTNMYIEFSFPLATPAAATYSFDITQMSFDISRSYPRTESLVNNFPLQLTGIVAGDASSTPSSMGYLDVRLPSLQKKQSVSGNWYALQYSLNMGTLGALTGGLGFNTVFLVTWNVGGTGAAACIKLPGVNPQAPFFSLQGVIKVNIGDIQLDVTDKTSYLMKINNIALKLLSLSFPPNGDINFFLFGNPNGRTAPQAVGWYGGYAQ